MRHSKVLLTVVILSCLFFSQSLIGAEIFVWDHDNALRVIDVTLQDTITAVEGVTQTFDRLEIPYAEGEGLPEDLSIYDVIVIPLGFACPS
ncbi:MAG: hypothetical protein HN356_07695 [Calditrichaeota bacterium]|jgi:hypothetical protein|nr:hypothetical protein [Calditrichota bacterium]MBT7619268.1 hypothetical protein [Calditrichota bacterium]MBT7669846.1 hypothetical protein [Bdellovibrionales bacterium]MBT7787905.1 hypothetical protein [Calditrichota bacterium]